MKWQRIGFTIAIIILFIFGIGWYDGSSAAGDGFGISEGYRQDTLNSFYITTHAAGRFYHTSMATAPPYYDFLDFRATDNWIGLDISNYQMFDSIKVDSIEWTFYITNESAADSIGLAFGAAGQEPTNGYCHRFNIIELDDTIYFYGSITCISHTTTIDSVPYLNSQITVPIVDCIKRDGSTVAAFERCILYYNALGD